MVVSQKAPEPRGRVSLGDPGPQQASTQPASATVTSRQSAAHNRDDDLKIIVESGSCACVNTVVGGVYLAICIC